jgi:hypothetical protein
MEKGGEMGVCGVEMMQVDYIFRGENLKYIRSYWHFTASAIHERYQRKGWLTGRDPSRAANRVYRGRDRVKTQTTSRLDTVLSISILPFSPSSLSSSLAPLL